MIKPTCDLCGKELKRYGAILFSPPKTRFIGEKSTCEKYHICTHCFEKIIKWKI